MLNAAALLVLALPHTPRTHATLTHPTPYAAALHHTTPPAGLTRRCIAPLAQEALNTPHTLLLGRARSDPAAALPHATSTYVRPPPLRPLVFAQISHARSHTIPHVLNPTRPAVRAHSRLRTTTSTPSSRLRTDLTRKAPRHTTATRTELTIPITRPLHYTSRPPLFPCLSTRGAIRLARLSSRIPGKMCRTLTRNRALAASGVHLRGKVAPRLNSTTGQSTKLQCWHLLLI